MPEDMEAGLKTVFHFVRLRGPFPRLPEGGGRRAKGADTGADQGAVEQDAGKVAAIGGRDRLGRLTGAGGPRIHHGDHAGLATFGQECFPGLLAAAMGLLDGLLATQPVGRGDPGRAELQIEAGAEEDDPEAGVEKCFHYGWSAYMLG